MLQSGERKEEGFPVLLISALHFNLKILVRKLLLCPRTSLKTQKH